MLEKLLAKFIPKIYIEDNFIDNNTVLGQGGKGIKNYYYFFIIKLLI